MGLDTVELVMKIEDEFKIAIPDDEAGKLDTIGKLVDYVHGRAPKPDGMACPSADAFYRLRQSLVTAIGTEPENVGPSTQLATLIPTRHRRRIWRNLRDASFTLPRLELSKPVSRLLWIGPIALILPSGLWLFAATNFEFPILSIFAACLGLVMCVALEMFLNRLLRPWATYFPSHLKSVGDLAHHVARSEGHIGTRKHVSRRIREITAEQLGMAIEEITEEKHLVRDLNMG